MHHAAPVQVPEQFLLRMKKLGIEARHLDRLAHSPEQLNEVAELVRTLLRGSKPSDAADPTPIEFEDALLEQTDLDIRRQNALRFAGIESVGVLALHTREFIGNIPTIGPGTLDRLEVTLGEYGLSFRDDLDESMAHKAERYSNKSDAVTAFTEKHGLGS